MVVVLAVSGVLLTNEYYNKMARNGGSEAWTDYASFPLVVDLQRLPSTHVYCLDWGILDSLRLLSRGTLPLVGSDDRFTKEKPTAEDREAVRPGLLAHRWQA